MSYSDEILREREKIERKKRARESEIVISEVSLKRGLTLCVISQIGFYKGKYQSSSADTLLHYSMCQDNGY